MFDKINVLGAKFDKGHWLGSVLGSVFVFGTLEPSPCSMLREKGE